MAQIADVTLTEVADGPGRGVRLLQFRNAGSISFDVALDRAADVGRVDALGRPVAFWSKVGLTPPWRWQDRTDGEGFLRSFAGGLFVTCGLDHVSDPERDPEPSTDGTTTGQQFPVHGRATGLPATLLGSGVTWTGDECELWAETEVRQAAVYGENLVLRRRISTPLGRAAITVTDRVTNENFRPNPHMVLYHCNIGFPAVDAATDLTFRPGVAAIEGPSMPSPLPDPDPTWAPRLQQLATTPGAPETEVSVSSTSGRCAVRWSSETLPYLMIWQNFEAGSYALGIEPSTNRPAGRQYARENGELRMLAPGETVEHRLFFDFDAGEESASFRHACPMERR